jgi:hypothetical protein
MASVAAPAQAVQGIGEQALPAPRGVLRMTIAPSFESFDERFLPDGETEPLGARLTTAMFGESVLPTLSTTSAAVRSLSGVTAFDASLGASSLRASTSINTLRLGAELGLTHRIAIRASLPIVRTRTEVALSLNGAQGGNLGVNPALLDSDLAQFQESMLDAQAAAAAALNTLLAVCAVPGATDSRCPTVQANLPALQSLATEAAVAAAAGNDLYGESTPFVPIEASSVDAVIDARLAALSAAFASWPTLGLPTFPGAVFAGADVPVASDDAQQLLIDPRFGVGIDSLVSRTRYGIGDIEVGASVLLIDTPGRERRLSPSGLQMRLAVSGGARIGTGEAPDPDRPFDPGTGDGQHDLIGAGHLDLLFGGRLWTTVTGRYVRQLEDRLMMRVAPRTIALAPFDTRFEVERDLGDIVELEIAPRFVLGRYVSVGARWAYRDKKLDRHEYAASEIFLPDGPRYPASVLDSATAYTEQELGVGFTYSTIAASARGLARLPVEITYQHVESLSADGGFLPKRTRDEVRVRLYLRLFGGA